jgi:hypothetical protein
VREPESHDVSPIKIREKAEVSLFGILLSPKLAGNEDLSTLLKSEINMNKIPMEEHL